MYVSAELRNTCHVQMQTHAITSVYYIALHHITCPIFPVSSMWKHFCLCTHPGELPWRGAGQSRPAGLCRCEPGRSWWPRQSRRSWGSLGWRDEILSSCVNSHHPPPRARWRWSVCRWQCNLWPLALHHPPGWNTHSTYSAKTPRQRHTYQKRGIRPSLTRSRVVLSKTSTSFSSLVLAVKMKSSSTHSTYFVVTWETARLRPANQPYDTRHRAWTPKNINEDGRDVKIRRLSKPFQKAWCNVQCKARRCFWGFHCHQRSL